MAIYDNDIFDVGARCCLIYKSLDSKLLHFLKVSSARQVYRAYIHFFSRACMKHLSIISVIPCRLEKTSVTNADHCHAIDKDNNIMYFKFCHQNSKRKMHSWRIH